MLVLAGVPGRLNCYRGELTGTSVRLPFLNQRQLLGRRGAANVMSGETWRSNIVSDPAEAVQVSGAICILSFLRDEQPGGKAECLVQIAGAAKLVGVLGIAPESKVIVYLLRRQCILQSVFNRAQSLVDFSPSCRYLLCAEQADRPAHFVAKAVQVRLPVHREARELSSQVITQGRHL